MRAFRFGVDCDVCTGRKALVPHRNAPLTETGRLRLARCVVEDGWPLRRAAGPAVGRPLPHARRGGHGRPRRGSPGSGASVKPRYRGYQAVDQLLVPAPVQLILRGHLAQLPTSARGGMCAICVLRGRRPSRPLDGRASDQMFLCAPGRIRTCDTRFRRAVLYPLSYEGGDLSESVSEIGARVGRPQADRMPTVLRWQAGPQLSHRPQCSGWRTVGWRLVMLAVGCAVGWGLALGGRGRFAGGARWSSAGVVCGQALRSAGPRPRARARVVELVGQA